MPPKTLFDINPHASFQQDDGAHFADRKELAVVFSETIAASSTVETWLGIVLIFLLGDDPAPALAMLQEDRNISLQAKKIKAAAACRLDGDDLLLFNAAIDAATTPASQRNDIAHGVVLVSPEVPDTILVAKQRDFQLFVMNCFRNHRGLPGATTDELKAFAKEFSKTIKVYEISDLKEILKSLQDAISILMQLSTLCAPAHHAKSEALKALLTNPEVSRRYDAKRKNTQPTV